MIVKPSNIVILFWLRVAPLYLIIASIIAFNIYHNDEYLILKALLVIAAPLLPLLIVFILFSMHRDSCEYKIDESEITSSSHFIFKTEDKTSYKNILNISSSIGPFQSIYEVGSVTLTTNIMGKESSKKITISDITNHSEVYEYLQKKIVQN